MGVMKRTLPEQWVRLAREHRARMKSGPCTVCGPVVFGDHGSMLGEVQVAVIFEVKVLYRLPLGKVKRESA